ncbi:MAG: CinA family protein [Hyphomicrobiaceae bacterium]
MFPHPLVATTTELLAHLRSRKLMVATAESCTGGLIAALLTEIAGSSDVVERGFVTYSNDAKVEMIGVPRALIDAHGAVSEQVARAMATGALAASKADIAVSVTGVAGPGGGSIEKPVGLVHFSAVRKGGAVIHHEARFGDLGRSGIRLATVAQALAMIRQLAP